MSQQGNYKQDHRSHGGDRNRGQTSAPLPPFSLLENGEIPAELFGKQALEIVGSIMNVDGRDFRAENTSSQVRRFYGEVKNLQRRLDLGEEWPRLRPLVKLVKAKIAYAKARNNGGLGAQFKTFIDKSIDQVESKEDFNSFCLLFEAVVGYLYGEGGLKDK